MRWGNVINDENLRDVIFVWPQRPFTSSRIQSFGKFDNSLNFRALCNSRTYQEIPDQRKLLKIGNATSWHICTWKERTPTDKLIILYFLFAFLYYDISILIFVNFPYTYVYQIKCSCNNSSSNHLWWCKMIFYFLLIY